MADRLGTRSSSRSRRLVFFASSWQGAFVFFLPSSPSCRLDLCSQASNTSDVLAPRTCGAAPQPGLSRRRNNRAIKLMAYGPRRVLRSLHFQTSQSKVPRRSSSSFVFLVLATRKTKASLGKGTPSCRERRLQCACITGLAKPHQCNYGRRLGHKRTSAIDSPAWEEAIDIQNYCFRQSAIHILWLA